MTIRMGTPPVEGIIAAGGFKLDKIEDPGNAGAIPVNRSGYVHLVTAGAETRTIARPKWVGQIIQLVAANIAAGDCVITASAAINQAGAVAITMNGANEIITLIGAMLGAGTLNWRVLHNDSAGLA